MKHIRLNNHSEIEDLLQRFLDGTTSLKDEIRLADYFRTNDVDNDWLAYKEMFAMFDSGEVECKNIKKCEYPNRTHSIWIALSTVAFAACITLVVLTMINRSQIQPDTPFVANIGSVILKHKESPKAQTDTTGRKQTEQPTIKSHKKNLSHNSINENKLNIENEPITENSPIDIDITSITEKNKDGIVKVEQDYQNWKLKQAILQESKEIDEVQKALEMKYLEYLEDTKNIVSL